MFLYPSQISATKDRQWDSRVLILILNRLSDQKPDQGLINKFQETFRDIVPNTTNRDARQMEQVDEGLTGYVSCDLTVYGRGPNLYAAVI